MVEPLFSVPVGWEVTTVAAIAARGGGDVQTGPFGSQLHAADYVQQGIPSVMPQNIGDNTISEEGIARISLEDAKRLTRYRLRTGDIVYSRRGDVEKRSLVRPTNDGWLCGTGCLRIRFGEGHVLPEYAAYYLAHPASKAWVVQHAVGATMPNLNTTILGSLPFVLPSMPEQISIAGILGSLDDKIELNRRMNETLEAMAQAIFRDWFVDFGPTRRKLDGATDPLTIMGGLVQDAERAQALADLFPAAFGDDGLPDGWRLGTLGDLAVSAGATVDPTLISADTPYIGLEHMPRKSIALSEWASASKVSSTKAKFDAGQILFGKLRPYFHKVGIAPVNGVCSTDIIVIDGKDIEERPLLTAIASSEEFVKFTDQSSTGTKMPRTSWGHMKTYPLAIASKNVRRQYGQITEPQLSKIVAGIHENRTLAATRDLLLPKLMSGEIRLSEAEELMEAAQ